MGTRIEGRPVILFFPYLYVCYIFRLFYFFSFLQKTSGQTGMCGGVRGVGAGGIVSSAYCLLFKLGTLKLTRKQVYLLLDHCDSPYIRGLGFMYIR